MKNEKSNRPTNRESAPYAAAISLHHTAPSQSIEVRRRHRLDMVIEECEAETEADMETVNRALELLAKWALRRGRKVLEEVGYNSPNHVNTGELKSYGD